jgi:hypothetical protein
MKLRNSKERNEITSKLGSLRRPRKLKSALESYGIVLEKKSHMLGPGDCQDWAFDELALPQYTWREGWREGKHVSERLMEGDIPELIRTENPIAGCLVAYLAEYLKEFYYFHYGLYQGRNLVVSRWGRNGHLFRHPIEMVPFNWGEEVHFYNKI